MSATIEDIGAVIAENWENFPVPAYDCSVDKGLFGNSFVILLKHEKSGKHQAQNQYYQESFFGASENDDNFYWAKYSILLGTGGDVFITPPIKHSNLMANCAFMAEIFKPLTNDEINLGDDE